MAPAQASIRNTFLRAVSPADYAQLAPYMAKVKLAKRLHLVDENRSISHVYYPESGMASIVALTPGRDMIEVGCFGYEGCSNFVLTPGQDRVPLRTFMQADGEGWKIDAIHFSKVLHASDSFMSLVMRYEQYKATQFAYTALSHGSYTIPERLARWILMAQDRLGNTITITHDYLAMMLAVRRSGVTEAIQSLEGDNLVRATRGHIEVLDRDGLIIKARGGYGAPEKLYERLIGPLSQPPSLALQ